MHTWHGEANITSKAHISSHWPKSTNQCSHWQRLTNQWSLWTHQPAIWKCDSNQSRSTLFLDAQGVHWILLPNLISSKWWINQSTFKTMNFNRITDLGIPNSHWQPSTTDPCPSCDSAWYTWLQVCRGCLSRSTCLPVIVKPQNHVILRSFHLFYSSWQVPMTEHWSTAYHAEQTHGLVLVWLLPTGSFKQTPTHNKPVRGGATLLKKYWLFGLIIPFLWLFLFALCLKPPKKASSLVICRFA